MKTFKVISSNPNQTGGFVTRISSEKKVVDDLMGEKLVKETYYLSGSKQLVVGVEVNVDLGKYVIREHPMLNPATQEEYMGKWLHLN